MIAVMRMVILPVSSAGEAFAVGVALLEEPPDDLRHLLLDAQLDPDRMPDRLHLEERGDPLRTLARSIVEPVEAGIGGAGRAACDPLHALRGRELRVRAQLVRDAPD